MQTPENCKSAGAERRSAMRRQCRWKRVRREREKRKGVDLVGRKWQEKGEIGV